MTTKLRVAWSGASGAVAVVAGGAAHEVPGLRASYHDAGINYAGDRGGWCELTLYAIDGGWVVRSADIREHEGGLERAVTDFVSDDHGVTWRRASELVAIDDEPVDRYDTHTLYVRARLARASLRCVTHQGATTAQDVVPARGDGDDRIAIRHVGDAVILALADGAGGTGGGARAAEAVVAAVFDVDAQPPSELLRALDRELARDGGQTTAILMVVTPDRIHGASVGDSEAWAISDAGVDVLTAHQRRKPLLGSGEAEPVAFERANTGATLLLASDGVFKYANHDRIVETIRSCAPADAPARIIDLARLPTGGLQDDASVIVHRR